jgi:hypothetical protein
MVKKIHDTQAALNALLDVYAMDSYAQDKDNPTPVPDERIAKAGWTVVGYLVAKDAVPVPGEKKLRFPGRVVNYGYLAKNADGAFKAVIRGTAGFVEWLEDADAQHLPYSEPGCKVEDGFYTIFQSMQFVEKAGSSAVPVLKGIETVVGNASITVVGHSLGSALGTYLALGLELYTSLKGRVSACLLASPRPGDKPFAALFDSHLKGRYIVYNYALDVVPRLPLRIMGFAPLPNAVEIGLSEAEAKITIEIGCNHHAVCYAAMLDYSVADWKTFPPVDQGCTKCIRGPRK